MLKTMFWNQIFIIIIIIIINTFYSVQFTNGDLFS